MYTFAQTLMFLIFMAFIVFAFTIADAAEACSTKDKNVKDLQALAILVAPKPVVIGGLK